MIERVLKYSWLITSIVCFSLSGLNLVFLKKMLPSVYIPLALGFVAIMFFFTFQKHKKIDK